jgi:hypothetical protein
LSCKRFTYISSISITIIFVFGFAYLRICSVNIQVPAPNSITLSICSQSIHFSICFAKNFELGVTEAFFLPFFICCNRKIILSSIPLCEIHIKKNCVSFYPSSSANISSIFFLSLETLGTLC